jgi:hypothetical protein
MEKIFANESEFKTKEELLEELKRVEDIVSLSEREKKVFVLSKQQDDFTVKIIFIFQLVSLSETEPRRGDKWTQGPFSFCYFRRSLSAHT